MLSLSRDHAFSLKRLSLEVRLDHHQHHRLKDFMAGGVHVCVCLNVNGQMHLPRGHDPGRQRLGTPLALPAAIAELIRCSLVTNWTHGDALAATLLLSLVFN